MGHLQVRSVRSIRLSFSAFFSTSRTEASASGLISFAVFLGLFAVVSDLGTALPIAGGQTISQPYVVGRMIEALRRQWVGE